MRNSLVTVALLTFPVLSSATGEDIDFKGVPFGASEQELTAKHPDFQCKDTDARLRANSDRSCIIFGKPDRAFQNPKHEAGTYAGVPANLLLSFYENRLSGATAYIFSAHFDVVVKALSERYGKPDKFETTIVKNRMGAEFQNETAQWTRRDVNLLATKYGRTISEGRVAYITTWGMDEFTKRRGQSAKKGAGDL